MVSVSSMQLALRYHKRAFFLEFFIYCFDQRLGFFKQMSTLAGTVGETKRRVTFFSMAW